MENLSILRWPIKLVFAINFGISVFSLSWVRRKWVPGDEILCLEVSSLDSAPASEDGDPFEAHVSQYGNLYSVSHYKSLVNTLMTIATVDSENKNSANKIITLESALQMKTKFLFQYM